MKHAYEKGGYNDLPIKVKKFLKDREDTLGYNRINVTEQKPLSSRPEFQPDTEWIP